MTMLFMQLATAAYACPQLETALQAPVMAATMPGCDNMPAQMDAEQPQLCKAHCDRDAQNTSSTLAPDLQPNPSAAMLLMGSVEPVQPPVLRGAAQNCTAALPRPPGAPPLYISLQVLRN
ncbi:hypothetical protein [Roseateles toxinivorans]|nr:hypothetical protein [Roseateles toxinivorans]